MLWILWTVLCLILQQSGANIIIHTTPGTGGINSTNECSSADVIFLLDCSSSIRTGEFKKELQFVSIFVNNSVIGPNKVQVGVITFSTTVKNEFNLSTYKTKSDILNAINKITFQGGRTHTWDALKYIQRKAFTVDSGGRTGIPKILVVITDGGSNDKQKTLDEAMHLHKNPIRVYAVGVGGALEMDELKAIASKQLNVFQVPDFSALSNIQKDIQSRICKPVCGVVPTDVVFLIDTSTSISDNDFKKQLDFVRNFVSDAIIGSKNTLVSVLSFTTNVVNEFNLKKYHNRTNLIKAVENIQRRHGNTYINLGLKYARENSFLPMHGGRNNAGNILIVITDGQSTDPMETAKEANLIHKTNIKVFAIGVGNAVDLKELATIASDQKHVYTVSNYKTLLTIEDEIFSKICRIKPT